MFPNDNNLESEFTFETKANPLAEEPPFHLLLLGDWSGMASTTNLSQHRPVSIDRDNFDEIMRRLKVGLELDLYGDGTNLLTLNFSELDDFHPDNLFRQLPVFSDLREIRRHLLNSDTFQRAAGEVRSWFNIDQNQASKVETAASSQQMDSENLLDAILSKPNDSAFSVKPQRTQNTELGRLISKIVTPHLITVDEDEQSKLVAAVDQATSDLMRTILHNSHFQQLESAWRGLYFLVRRIETDVDLKIFILDLKKDQLTGDLKNADSLSESEIYRWLIRETIETPGGQPWSVIGGNYSFDLNIDDIATLMRLAKLCAAAEAPFVSYIRPQMFGVESFAENEELYKLTFQENTPEGKLWSTLRQIPESEYLGLSPTRFLARLPYGKLTDAIETFSFEEFNGEDVHEQYLWTNPCFACTYLLAQSYRQNGWEMARNLSLDIQGLPMHVYQEDAETKTKACAEVVLTENLAEILLNNGLMPLLSYRNSDRVRLARFQAISDPVRSLNGAWRS